MLDDEMDINEAMTLETGRWPFHVSCYAFIEAKLLFGSMNESEFTYFREKEEQ